MRPVISGEFRAIIPAHLCTSLRQVEQNFVLKPENDPDGALSRALRSRKTLLQKMKVRRPLLLHLGKENHVACSANGDCSSGLI
eukprot:SAG31_NODE_1269_length_9066_cov_7.882792_7_plen_84_part_00